MEHCSKKMRLLGCLGEAGLISCLHRHITARTNCSNRSEMGLSTSSSLFHRRHEILRP
jgi:hypothetical protein